MLANERFVANAPAEVVAKRAREARALPPRARCDRRLRLTGVGGRLARVALAWPADGFGPERMQALLARLGNPQRSFDAIHVVGTKGKSTAARRIARADRRPRVHLAARGGLARAARHRPGRLRARGRARARRRGGARRDAVRGRSPPLRSPTSPRAVRRRGGRGRARRPARRDERDRRARRPADERRARAHRRARRDARGDRRREARGRRPATRSSCSPTTSSRSLVPGEVRLGGAAEAAEAFLGDAATARRGDACPAGSSCRDARGPRRRPHAGGRRLAARAAAEPRTATSSSPRSSRDKDAAGILERLARAGSTLVATRSSNARALPAEAVAELAARPLRAGRDGRPTRAGARLAPGRIGSPRPRHRLALPACRSRR